MSMEEWPDDHLDELFRKSAEEYDVPINNDDWTDMSRRLDQFDRQTLFDRVSRWGGVGALVLLLLAGLGWVMYDKKPAANPRLAVVITTITPGREVATERAKTGQTGERNAPRTEAEHGEPVLRNVPEKPITGVAGKAERQPQATGMGLEPSGQSATKAVTKQALENDEPAAGRPVAAPVDSASGYRPVSRRKSAETTGAVPATSTRATRRKVRLLAKGQTLPASKKPMLERGPVADNNPVNSPTGSVPKPMAGTYPVRGGSAVGNKGSNQPAMTPELGERTQPAIAEQGADGPWLPALTDALSLSNVVQHAAGPMPAPSLREVTVSAPVQRSVPRLSRLSILLFASPDLSTVGLKNFERPGSNAGLAAQYQLTDRLSINTAFMYSSKRYQTSADNYVLTSIPHIYVFPETVLGICNMIDIPLNIRYDWLLRPRGNGRAPARWFASAGLTSYFIQHEVYTYQYANPDDPKVKYQPKDWDNRTEGVPGGAFGFSNINLSVGYERPITHRLSWQVEPFMKVPLKQVGYFQVKLLSTGAFVGLRYHL